MIRYKLKCGGRPRKKALLGADGAIMAAATLTAAAMNTTATASAAKNQANAIENSAKTQAAAIKAQTTNNTQLQQENINFTRQQNKENRDQQQAIQTTLQMIAGQQNMNEQLDKSKVAVKYGGSKNAKARVQASHPFYGGASAPFKVTDGGGVIPLNVDNNGYGLYEIYGNDHDHYHKTSSGKYKSGVGFKFNDGTVVEGEGNQNTNQGELFYVTPQDAMFISKHSINGFNPTKAIQQGMHPQEAFNIQQSIKTAKGIADDGNKISHKRNTADDGWLHEFIKDTKNTGRDLIEALTTRKGIARGIKEFGQGVPFLSGALDSFADYVEGDNGQPVYGIDANGNQHFIGYAPSNNNENALFSIISGPARGFGNIAQQANKSKQIMSVARAAMNNKINSAANATNVTKPTLATSIAPALPQGIPINTAQPIPIDKRALVRYRQRLRDARYNQWLEAFNRRSEPIDAATHAARTKALNRALQIEKAKDAINKVKQTITKAGEVISNNRDIITKGAIGAGSLGVIAGLTGIGHELYKRQNISYSRSNEMSINANLAHPYVDSYRQANDNQQYQTKATQQAKSKAKQITTQKQITNQQAKQDAINNKTTKMYKNFNDAFDAAITRGDKTFTFGGLEYAAIKAKGDDSRNRRWGARRTEQVMNKYNSWNDYLNRKDKRKMKYGGRVKAANGSYWQNYGGATYNAMGNILGAGVNVLGNYFAGNALSKAYTNAGNILANAYDKMSGIDLSSISREDYSPAHAMAVVRSVDTNVNPQLERLRRNAASERKEVNRNTLSSAARQQRLAGIDDRMYQRAGEVYATKHNEDEKIKQQNVANIQDISKTNAMLDAQSSKDFASARLSLMQYNNNIANAKIAGRAQSLADAATQSSSIRASAMQNSASAIGSALASIGQGFASAYDANKKQQADFNNTIAGADTSTVINYLVNKAGNASSQDKNLAETYYNMFKDSTDNYQASYAKMLAKAYGFGANDANVANDYMFPELIGTSHPFYRYSVIRR